MRKRLNFTEVLFVIIQEEYKIIKFIHKEGGVYLFDDRADFFEFDCCVLCMNYYGDLVYNGTDEIFSRKRFIFKTQKTAIKYLTELIDSEIYRLTKIKESL